MLNYTITQDTDTRDESIIFVLKISDKLTAETYKQTATAIKKMGGYYSKFKHGFIFKTEPNTADVENALNGTVSEDKSEPNTVAQILKAYGDEFVEIHKMLETLSSNNGYKITLEPDENDFYILLYNVEYGDAWGSYTFYLNENGDDVCKFCGVGEPPKDTRQLAVKFLSTLRNLANEKREIFDFWRDTTMDYDGKLIYTTETTIQELDTENYQDGVYEEVKTVYNPKTKRISTRKPERHRSSYLVALNID